MVRSSRRSFLAGLRLVVVAHFAFAPEAHAAFCRAAGAATPRPATTAGEAASVALAEVPGTGITTCSPATATVDVEPEYSVDPLQDWLFVNDQGELTFTIKNTAPKPPGAGDCSGPKATPLLVDVTVSKPRQAFTENLRTHSISLQPQQSRKIIVAMLDLEPFLNYMRSNWLYGAQVDLTFCTPTRRLGKESLSIYRFLDASDDDPTDGLLLFERTLADGWGGTVQRKPFGLRVAPAATPILDVDMPASYGVEGAVAPAPFGYLRFDPNTTSTVTSGELQIFSPQSKAGNPAGTIELRGWGIEPQGILFPMSELRTQIDAILAARPVLPNSVRFREQFLAAGDAPLPPAELASRVTGLYEGVVSNMLVSFNSASPFSGSALEVQDRSAGRGMRIQTRSDVMAGRANQCGTGTGTGHGSAACAAWADFAKNRFFDEIVGVRPPPPPPPGTRCSAPPGPSTKEKETSVLQKKYRFSELLNRSESDAGMIFNLDLKVRQLEGPCASPPRPPGQDCQNAIRRTAPASTYRKALAHRIANTLTHEVGHNLGSMHLRSASATYIAGGIMGDGSHSNRPSSFSDKLAPAIRLALGLQVEPKDFEKTYDYYRSLVGCETDPFNGEIQIPIEIGGPILEVFDAPIAAGDQTLPDTPREIDLGPVIADGPGGREAAVDLFLFNDGDRELTISEAGFGPAGPETEGAAEGFSVRGLETLPLRLPPLAGEDPEFAASTRRIELVFDPRHAGPAAATVRIDSDSLIGPREITVTGLGVAPVGVVVEIANNNVGGAEVGQRQAAPGFATVRNPGAAAVTLGRVAIEGGSAADFALDGPLADKSSTTLAAGEELRVDLTFAPRQPGLRGAELVVTSADPGIQALRRPIVGTGVAAGGAGLHYGKDHVALETPLVAGSPVRHAISGDDGGFNLQVPPEASFHYAIFDPESGLIAHGYDVSGPQGEQTRLSGLLFLPSLEPDTDGDYLPDDVELALGTSAVSRDTNGDGTSDFDALRQGIELGQVVQPTPVEPPEPKPAVDLAREMRQVSAELAEALDIELTLVSDSEKRGKHTFLYSIAGTPDAGAARDALARIVEDRGGRIESQASVSGLVTVSAQDVEFGDAVFGAELILAPGQLIVELTSR